MSEGTENSPRPKAALARKRIEDLALPHSPMFGFDSDLDYYDYNDFLDIPSPPWTADSANGFGVSRFSDESSEGDPCSTSLGSTFEEWDDFPSLEAEVTIDWDGSQLIHIPCESPFFRSHSHGFPLSANPNDPLSPSSSPASSASSSTTTLQDSRSNGHSPLLIITHKSDDEDDASAPAQPPAKIKLFVETAFLTPQTGATSPTLSPSWYFSGSSIGGDHDSFSWETEGSRKSILDVPSSAVSSTCPMDLWDDRDEGLSYHSRQMGADS